MSENNNVAFDEPMSIRLFENQRKEMEVIRNLLFEKGDSNYENESQQIRSYVTRGIKQDKKKLEEPQ